MDTTIATKVIRRGPEQMSNVLDAHLSQYFESKSRRAMKREIMSDTVAIAPPCAVISTGNDVCVLDTAATMLINT